MEEEESPSGHTPALLLALLTAGAAFGMAAFWFAGNSASGEATPEPAAAVATTEAPAPPPAPRRKTRVTWQGGGEGWRKPDDPDPARPGRPGNPPQ